MIRCRAADAMVRESLWLAEISEEAELKKKAQLSTTRTEPGREAMLSCTTPIGSLNLTKGWCSDSSIDVVGQTGPEPAFHKPAMARSPTSPTPRTSKMTIIVVRIMNCAVKVISMPQYRAHQRLCYCAGSEASHRQARCHQSHVARVTLRYFR